MSEPMMMDSMMAEAVPMQDHIPMVQAYPYRRRSYRRRSYRPMYRTRRSTYKRKPTKKKRKRVSRPRRLVRRRTSSGRSGTVITIC